MSLANPNNLQEWAHYIESLGDLDLFSKASAANTMRFFNSLLEDGFDAAYIKSVMMLFARKFRDIGIQPPGGGLYDLIDMMAETATLSVLPKGRKMVIPPEPDEIDRGLTD